MYSSIGGSRQTVPDPKSLGARSRGHEHLTIVLDAHVYIRWQKYGWQLGKIYSVITNATPRLVKKFTLSHRLVRRQCASSKGPAASLAIDNYGFGESARFDSWVILKRIEEGS